MSKLAIAYGMKKKAKGYDEGGKVQPSPSPTPDSQATLDARNNISKSFKGALGFSQGGEVNQKPVSLSEMIYDDLVDRIMHKKTPDAIPHMSEGGKVANETDIDCADSMPNQFDDLVLDDDLESSFDGDNAGDHLGNAAEDKDQSDIVSRILKSQSKKDKMPRPA